MQVARNYREKSKEHLLNDRKWIYWPIQPMKNMRRRVGGFPLIGVVVSGKLNVVYGINFLTLKRGPLWEQLEGVSKWEYSSVEEMFDDGWEVD